MTDTPDILPDGHHQTRHESGYLATDFHVKNGVLEGHYEAYHDNGAKAFEAYYEHGQLQGKTKAFFANKKTAFITHYKDNLLDGVSIVFDEKTGQPRDRKHFKENKLNGTAEEYDDNGQLKRLSFFSENKYDTVRTAQIKTVLKVVQLFDHARTLLGFLPERRNTREQIDTALHVGF